MPITRGTRGSLLRSAICPSLLLYLQSPLSHILSTPVSFSLVCWYESTVRVVLRIIRLSIAPWAAHLLPWLASSSPLVDLQPRQTMVCHPLILQPRSFSFLQPSISKRQDDNNEPLSTVGLEVIETVKLAVRTSLTIMSLRPTMLFQTP